MPELPDITVYQEALERRLVGQTLAAVRCFDSFVLRTALPPIDSLVGRQVERIRRLGKRLAFGFEGDRWLVLHLMIAGRLQWQARPVAGSADPGRALAARPKPGAPHSATAKPTKAKKIPNALVEFVFATGTLTLTEAGSKRRAALHVVDGEDSLGLHDRGGIDVLAASRDAWVAQLRRENHTLKRALTDPRLFSGIGNAYSDEILHAARLSPVALTDQLAAEEATRLHGAVQRVLTEWTGRLRAEAGDGFPARVTAFRPEMAVHGKFGQPCPVCGTTVQRIRYAENEVNYCPRCQTGGKLLADRSLSRLLKGDWPRTIDEAEERGRA